MKILSIYVDLNKPEEQLDTISNYFSHYNASVQAGDRLWFVKTTKKPKEICAEINELGLTEGFHALVFEVGEKWATESARDEVNSWMGKHI